MVGVPLGFLSAVAQALGSLIAKPVMAAGVESRQTEKTIAAHELVEQQGGWFEDLPERSFAESGTNINTVLCVIGRRHRW